MLYNYAVIYKEEHYFVSKAVFPHLKNSHFNLPQWKGSHFNLPHLNFKRQSFELTLVKGSHSHLPQLKGIRFNLAQREAESF